MTQGHTESQTKPLRPTVVPVLYDFRTLKFLAGRIHPERKSQHHWSTVEGGIEVSSGETVAGAARRELFEEVGLVEVVFIAAVSNHLIYTFDGHHRYSGKSLAVLFYGFTRGPARYLNLNPGIDPEGPAFRGARWTHPQEAGSLLKMGATKERQGFCDRLAKHICEIHVAMRIAALRRRRSNMDLVKKTQQYLVAYGNGQYITEEVGLPHPPTQPPERPERKPYSPLGAASAVHRCLHALRA